MTTASEHDVVIVGASLAGCSAAILLARQGLRVALVERSSDPGAYKKVCTHYIQPCANATMCRLGVLDTLIAAGARPNRAEVWTPYGWAPWVEGETPGYNVRRETLDPLLRAMAVKTPGVSLLLGHNARAVLEDQGRISGVVVEGPDAIKRELRARLVVAADGRHGKLGELAGVPAQASEHGRFLYFAYYQGLPIAAGDASMIWFANPDAAYCFPNDGNTTVVAVMPTKDQLPAFRANLEQAFIEYFERLPHAPQLRGARRVSDFLGMIEMPNHVRAPAARGMAFIGDAALTSDPIFGVGCGWAMQSAEWLADAVGPALVAKRALEPALTAYAAEHRGRLLAHHKMICDMSSGRPFNPIERLLFRACARDERISRGFQRVGGRVLQPGQFLTPATLLRIMWVNLSGKALRAPGPRPYVAAPASENQAHDRTRVGVAKVSARLGHT